MEFLSRLSSLWRNLFERRRVDGSLDDELHSYLEQLTDEKMASGLSAEEARRAARMQLGGMEQVKEEVRQARTGRLLQEFFQDLRYGVRTLRHNPGFTSVAVVALALGIGANTAMFSVAYGMLFRPLPYANADRVAVVYMRYFPRDFAFGTLSIRDYLMWKENNRAFETPSLFRSWRMDISGSEDVPEQVQGAVVTAGFFSTLGMRPLLGRTFAAGEDQPATASFAVISETMWRRRFASSSRVLGETILVNGAPATVIGVMPGSFQFPPRAELWTNLILNPPNRYGPYFYRGVARLRPGVTLQQAQSEVNNIALRMMQQNPNYKRLTLPVSALRDALLGTTLKPAILVLGAAVGLVLLIAVVNVANLMLARATVREREMAMRLSLGAGRGRLVRQLLTESVLLAFVGGVAGLLVAWGAIEMIRVSNPGNLPFIGAVQLDSGALVFMAVVSMLTGVLFGLVPALEGTRADLNSTIKEGGRGAGPGSRRTGARSGLVVSEIALSLILLVGAVLLLRSFANLQRVTGGFSTPPKQLLTMLVSPGDKKYREAHAGIAFYDEVLRRVRNIPGVEMATVTDSLPPDRQGDADTFGIEGQILPQGEMNPIVTVGTVGPNYFKVLGVPLLGGRYFNDHDKADSTPVTIVSEGFAQRFFPNQKVIGKRIRESGEGMGNPWMEVVGVVGNLKYLGLAIDTDPAYYMSFAQNYGQRMFLAVRTAGDAGTLAATLRREVQSIDPGVTLAQVSTMEEALTLSVSQPRFNSLLLSVFASIAMLLAAVGIYGLIAYTVAQRTHEIGVRMALGAERTDVVWMVVRQGASLAAIGIVLGFGGAFGLTRLLKSMLFGIGVTDMLTFAAAPVGMLMVVLLATLIPALRATRISPVVSLRYE